MADDARIRVRLDTSAAEKDLADLGREGERTGKRLGGRIRGAVGRGLGAVGLGGGIGAGLSAVRGATQSGLGDVIGEAFGGIGAQLNDLILGKLDDVSRANRAAREETIQGFAHVAGRTRSVPPAAVAYFRQVSAIRTEQEVGASILRERLYKEGPGVGDLVDRILTGLHSLLVEAVDALASKLRTFIVGK